MTNRARRPVNSDHHDTHCLVWHETFQRLLCPMSSPNHIPSHLSQTATNPWLRLRSVASSATGIAQDIGKGVGNHPSGGGGTWEYIDPDQVGAIATVLFNRRETTSNSNSYKR